MGRVSCLAAATNIAVSFAGVAGIADVADVLLHLTLSLSPPLSPPPSVTCAGPSNFAGIEKYEFELRSSASKVNGTKGEGRQSVLQIRCDSWRSLHAWVNGLTLLAAYVRSNSFKQQPVHEPATEMISMPMSVWARDQAAVRRFVGDGG